MNTEVSSPHSADTGVVEHAHPGPGRYVTIAVILGLITGAEVLVYYQPSVRPVIVPILGILSALKFALVVLFFMHLRYDSRLFSMVFVGPLVLAASIMVAVLSIFHGMILGI
ncbi:MAG TPA: cytochrome C oxidase subunit IV family protein [Chloroflexota bacterium]|nr:cytochrome C oxidase subunit IV family protein [Chloroflexota bacterium]